MELPGAAATLVHLAAVAAEGFSASTLSRLSRDQQRRLAAATPVFALPGETVLVAATGLPDAGSVEAVVDRATRLALGLERPSVIVDLSHLGEVGPEALSGLLALADDVERLGGRCVVTGLSERLERAAAEAGVDLAALATRTDVSAALPDAMGKRGPFKRARNR